MDRSKIIWIAPFAAVAIFWMICAPHVINIAAVNPNSKHPDGITLYVAAEQNDTNMLADLLDHGADIESHRGYRELCTPLHCAALKGNIAAMAFLLSRGANVNSVDRDAETPLHYAAKNDHAEAVTFLIKHGANINAMDIDRATPLEAAVKDERVHAMRALLEAGADADFDGLIASVKSEMAEAPLAAPAMKDQWNETIAVLQEFKEKTHWH